ncbi:MAG: hypothetical protein DRP93_09060 [Candidatus Neomarinimicrobiota bacterium]|nr:MAG: hypothetical protein DRP93_09060 [Candidatus Neomarinimicrobiota bacterium]
MKKVIEKVEEVELSLVDRLLVDVLVNEKISKKMSEKELLIFVSENFDNEDIKSKNGMLKYLRSEGNSCSMDRVFNMYKKVEDVVKKFSIKKSVEDEKKESKEREEEVLKELEEDKVKREEVKGGK